MADEQMAGRPAPSHPVFQRVFRAQRLSLGLVLPLTAQREDDPDPARQRELAALADRLGFDALWVRDVPLNSPGYPDPVGHLDAWVHLGALAAQTRSIALVTGAIVAPLRHPLHVAKAALSLDALSKGRFILGLGSGDRPPEFAAFGRRHGERAALYRAHWARIAAASGAQQRIIGDQEDEAQPTPFEMRPRATHGEVPMLVVGSAQQSLDWIARNAHGWATYHRPLAVQRGRFELWRAAQQRAAGGQPRGFAEAFNLRLSEDAGAPPQEIELGYQLGRHALLDLLEQHRAMGIEHVMFNLTGGGRPVAEVLDELAREVLPRFQRA